MPRGAGAEGGHARMARGIPTNTSVPMYIPLDPPLSPELSVPVTRDSAAVPAPASRRTMDALRRLVRVLATSARSAPAAAGISGAQLFLLRQIGATPGLAIGELASRALAGQSTVSEVVSRLVARRLVQRSRGKDDARRVVLTLTRHGAKVIEHVPPTAQERLVEGLASMTPAQQARLAQSLEDWLSRAGLDRVSPTMFFEDGRGPGATRTHAATRRRRDNA